MRFALGVFVALASALCPLKTCFDRDGGFVPAAPGSHGHEGHQGPDRDSGCCTDVPHETGGPWFVVHLDVPLVRWAAPAAGPRTPSASFDAPRAAALRPTVLLR